ncbi:hypothetical protein [Veillonella intestinalis]|uniref:hypothetical protein n=1 Tax=Veillonella intestinalis TaxID=2941341 RepID=UPI00203F50FE|nr:hypothetical protein [Veillonella intestinalis]
MNLARYGQTLVVAILLTVGLALPLMLFLSQGLVETPYNLISYNIAILAYVAWLIALVLMSGLSYINRMTSKIWPGFNLHLHRLLGPLSVLLGLIHYYMSFSMHEEVVYTGISGGIIVVGAMVSMMTLRPSKLRRWLHRTIVLGIFLIWLHVHLIVRVANVTSFILAFDAYTLIALTVYIWKYYKK